MGLACLVLPGALSHRADGKLGHDDGPIDGSGYLLGALNTQADIISDGNQHLEPGPPGSASAQEESSRPHP